MSLRLDQVPHVDLMQLDQGFFDYFGVEKIGGDYVSTKIQVDNQFVPVFVGRPSSETIKDRRFPSISITFVGSYNDNVRLESFEGGVILEDNGSQRTITKEDPIPQLAFYRLETWARTEEHNKQLVHQLIAAFPTYTSIDAGGESWYMFRQELANADTNLFNQYLYHFVMDVSVSIVILPSFTTRAAYTVKTLDLGFYIESKLQNSITIEE